MSDLGVPILCNRNVPIREVGNVPSLSCRISIQSIMLHPGNWSSTGTHSLTQLEAICKKKQKKRKLIFRLSTNDYDYMEVSIIDPKKCSDNTQILVPGHWKLKLISTFSNVKEPIIIPNINMLVICFYLAECSVGKLETSLWADIVMDDMFNNYEKGEKYNILPQN